MMVNKRPVTIYLMPWGRVGSNLVNSIMEQGQNVTVYNEPLTPIDMKCRRQNLSEDETWVQQEIWLKTKILTDKGTHPIFLNLAAVHIKDPKAFTALMAQCDPVYLVHDRHDVVATVVSAMRTQAWVQEGVEKGEKRGWSLPKGGEVKFRPRIEITDFLKMTNVVENGRKIIAQITQGQHATTYYYEDILFDMEGVIVDIFAKARIPYHPYEVKSGKFGSEALADMVENASELSAAIIAQAIPTQLILEDGL